MINPKMVQIQFWSCGCITFNLILPDGHDLHPNAILVGLENRLIEWMPDDSSGQQAEFGEVRCTVATLRALGLAISEIAP